MKIIPIISTTPKIPIPIFAAGPAVMFAASSGETRGASVGTRAGAVPVAAIFHPFNRKINQPAFVTILRLSLRREATGSSLRECDSRVNTLSS
jgi:hypothetical protein